MYRYTTHADTDCEASLDTFLSINSMNLFLPLKLAADWLTYDFLALPSPSPQGVMVSFFLEDVTKILILVFVISFFAGLVRFYLPIDRVRHFLTTRKLWGLDYVLATLFGAVTPFCTCSSIPLFMGFLRAGIPLGVTFAFLITSPIINEVAIGLFLGLFGVKVTLLYVAAGIGIGMAGGAIMGKLHMEKYVEPFVWNTNVNQSTTLTRPPLSDAFPIVARESLKIFRQVALYVVMGVAVGAAIHGYVPADFFEAKLKMMGIFSVPAAVILGVPLYANATSVIPIVQSLIAKGVPLGTGLAFMMAVVGLSFPEAMILKKVLKLPLLGAFFGIVTVGIILIGYFFNFIL